MIQNKKILCLSVWFFTFVWSLSTYASSDVTPVEQKQVEANVLLLQNHILENSQNMYDTLTQKFESLSSYEENGNLSLGVEIHESEDTNMHLNASLKNYTSKIAWMDSELHWDLALEMYGTNQEDYNWSLSWHLSTILESWDVYLAVQDMISEGSGDILFPLTYLTSYLEDGKYLKLGTDNTTKEFLQLFSQKWVKWVFDGYAQTLSKPLFVPYKKIGESYELIPSTAFCEAYFNVNANWYTGDTCTNANYKLLVKKFLQTGTLIYSEDVGVYTLSYTYKKENDFVNAFVSYDGTSLKKVQLSVTPDQKKYPNEWVELDYRVNDSLNLSGNFEGGKINFSFDGKLDKNNRFTFIDSKSTSPEMIGTFSLKNNKILGNILFKQYGYDYNEKTYTYKKKLQNIFASKITGSLKSDHSLNTLKVQFWGVDVAGKEVFLKGNFIYSDGNISHRIDYNDLFFSLSSKGSGVIGKQIFDYTATFDVLWYHGDVNMSFDTSNNKNNADIKIELNDDMRKIFGFFLKNEATRTYKDGIKIEAPTDFNEYDPYGYYDDIYDENFDWESIEE